MLSVLFYIIICAPLFWVYVVRDLFNYIKRKGWHDFNYWGLHLFVGKFGGGKTISMIRRAWLVCKTHRGVTILTNLNLFGFPKDTNIIKLKNINQVLDLPDKSIVLIDEIGSVFNNRDVMSNKDKRSVPKPVFQHLVQMRHRRIMVLGTVSRWNLVDKQLRDITDTITECHSYFKDPFARYTTCTEFDAVEYDHAFGNPLLPIRRIGYYSYVQTNELRSKYDTIEMVEGLLDGDYFPDEQILANRAGINFDPHELGGKKTERRYKKGANRL